ncbi:AAA family ATPase [Sphingomonas sp.]|uniref:AAA family ATPase n=1 Tax=Sphingomonas sp. TaxID=28214 RepID=UPI0025F32A96|nr:AAA family ATPase [Sphingomonas sp.]
MEITFKPLIADHGVDDNQPQLLPAQQRVYDKLAAVAKPGSVTALIGNGGCGNTTVLKKFADDNGLNFLDKQNLIDLFEGETFHKYGNVVLEYLNEELRLHGNLVIDSFGEWGPQIGSVFKLFQLGMADLQKRALLEGYRLIFGADFSAWEWALDGREVSSVQLFAEPFGEEDYRAYFAERFGADAITAIDFGVVHDAAPGLDLYQISFLANLLDGADLSTDSVITSLERDVLKANLRLREVEALSFDSLPGSEHIAEALETHIILPFENKVLARELDLKPRRGVLLYGPPGTGKTSIGRALAHRMQGRFFLIDGTFVTEPPVAFFGMVDRLIAQAKKNAPCVLFIDDADVLFQIEHIAGLQRYLLSLLDGLESETASHVCVMMTAMDAKKVPEPLLRSGRVELWLETKAPDEVTRGRILERWMAADMPGREDIDYPALARLTQGFTPADLRRLASDAKLLYASDLVAKRPIADANRYLELAIDDLITLRATMAERLDDATLKVA